MFITVPVTLIVLGPMGNRAGTLLTEVGLDLLICAGMVPANVMVGEACLDVALIAKKAEE